MINEKDVEYVAALSRIHLQPEEIHKLTKNLEDIVSYIDQLKQVDVTDIEPTSHALPLTNAFREDQVKKCFTQEEALRFSVEQLNGSYKVPKVIE
jgi:aspartyl-tRNA(Asn)/glutamyl-tRNA(Gln) amidotransferase subunit C